MEEKTITVEAFEAAVEKTTALLGLAVNLSESPDPIKVEILTGVKFGLKMLATTLAGADE